jgi:inhibitor of KinA sporulation pathway (predicted exonuclease)
MTSNSIEKDYHQDITHQYISHSDCVNSSTNIITTNSVGQPFDYYCVLDFEAVCHQANPNLKYPAPNDIWEIIEFPICLLESESNTIIDTYHSYVRPTIKTKLNEKCINITGITQDIVDKSPTFDIVWKDVQRFLAKHSLISFENNNSNLRSFTWITCGNWDLRTMLPLQLKQNGFNRPKFINNFINLKDLYNEYYPTARIKGMKDMLQKSNLKLEGRHHSGIDDTKNIARIAQWLIQNKKILKLTQKETL